MLKNCKRNRVEREREKEDIIREFKSLSLGSLCGCTFPVTPDGECLHEGIRYRDVGGRQVLGHHVRVTPDEYEIHRLRYTHETQHEEAGYQETASGEAVDPSGAAQRARPDADEAQIETIPSDREVQVYAEHRDNGQIA